VWPGEMSDEEEPSIKDVCTVIKDAWARTLNRDLLVH
jgi:hypothetical protein